MHIDWFTFVAQIVNFLVLAGLLRWFLYGPIVRAMRQRQEKIASRLHEAQHAYTEAEAKGQQYEEKIRELEQQREELLREARRKAHQYRERLTQEAREDAQQKRHEWLRACEREREEILDEFRNEIGRLAETAARHTLAELASEDLEERMLRNFVARLQHLDARQRAEIEEHLNTGEAEIRLRSSFEISEPWRNRLCKLIRDQFGHDGDVAIEKSTEFVCGLELDVGGYSFGWNVDEMLRQLRLDFGERLRKKDDIV